MKTIERIGQYIDYKEFSYLFFEKKISVSYGYIRGQFRKKATISSDVIEKICVEFPDINPTWLISGKGEMIQSTIKAYDIKPALEKVEDPEFIYETLKSKDKEIALQYQVIETKQRLVEQLDAEIAVLKKENESLRDQLSR